MSGPKDGGPAFPHSEIWDDDKPEIAWIAGGLSKRDYFAGQALPNCVRGMTGGMNTPETIAHHAYSIADAMIAEGNKS